jgi:hypothetical protein
LRDSPPTATLPLMKPMTISASPMIFLEELPARFAG